MAIINYITFILFILSLILLVSSPFLINIYFGKQSKIEIKRDEYIEEVKKEYLKREIVNSRILAEKFINYFADEIEEKEANLLINKK
jgi:Na+-translocating ferredoxin:NAD+ oxidoreductase RnfG subunit